MTSFIDYYKLLGVEFKQSQSQIKQAFIDLAKAHHPDRRGGDENRFKEINRAYMVLSKKESRLKYDRVYLRHYYNKYRAQPVNIPFSRLIYPVTMQSLAEQGLLRKKVKRSDRKKILKKRINYDIEVPLNKAEVDRPIQIDIPLFARVTCPICQGSNRHCYSCDGKGNYKTTETFTLFIKQGLKPGQMIEVNLEGQKPQAMAYFRKKRLLIKTSLDNRTLKTHEQN